MKRTLFLCGTLLGVSGLLAQTTHSKLRPNKALNIKKQTEEYLKLSLQEQEASVALKQPASQDQLAAQGPAIQLKTSAAATSSINWQLLCGSMNVYGQLVSQSRPLQYNDNVNTVSVIHRKSATYVASPLADSNAGTIVAEISADWGASWDSTCLYANTEAGRYPQGAVYSSPGNSDIANAYVVGSGPTVSNNAFTGNWYASKKLATPGSTLYNNAGDPTANAQQFIPFNAPGMQNHSWSRYGFSSTDDGAVRSVGLLENDPTTLGDMTGVAVVKGTFNAGVFTWAADVLTPSCIVQSDGTQAMFSSPQMAWNEAGTVGYVVIPGALNSATGSNRGFQPIVYKTTNSGASWALVNGIDFNAPTMTVVLQHIAATASNPTLAIPAVFGDYDITVDANNKLHIGMICMSTFSPNDDSLGFVGSFTNGSDNYNWGHVPGNRPYLWDFIGDGTAAWDVVLVDSMSTEGPSSQPSGAGYNENPWDPTGTGSAKIQIEPRIQLGRTPNGQYITFSWVESDTNFTSSAKKWNVLPDIKSRLMSIGSGTNMYQVSPTELNVTQYPVSVGPANPQVITRATLHYMSPTTGSAQITNACPPGYTGETVNVRTPFTITNSNPYSQLTNNTTWFTAANLGYDFCKLIDGMNDQAATPFVQMGLYPNPATQSVQLKFAERVKENIEVKAYSLVGQEAKRWSFDASAKEELDLDLSGLTPGIYMIEVSNGKSSSTKKLVVK